ncbi:MAG: hypothetical protein LBV33_03185 [Lachnospiraceae bacterium]|nr:hypothetical protein [Lachnospiraceae bacterium]
MAVITHQDIKVVCKTAIQSLVHFEYHTERDGHIYAEIVGQIPMEEVASPHRGTVNEFIEIKATGHEWGERSIFTGMIIAKSFGKSNGRDQIIIRAVSSTWAMDIEEKSRSFQDANHTYKGLVEYILSEYDNGDMIFDGVDRLIEGPLIQYQETDWAFIRRIMSHLGVTVRAECRTKKILFICGEYNSGKRCEVDDRTYSLYFDQNYYFESASPLYDRGNYVYYEVNETRQYQLGDQAVIEGRRLTIYEKSGRMEKGILHFGYRLANQTATEVKRYDNQRLVGRALTGTVLAVKRECIKVHLEIDKEQSEASAYFFPWCPLSGNLLYGMPEVGERVRLYLPDGREQNAIGINVLRNEAMRATLPDASQRYFRTADNKGISLIPTAVGIKAVGTTGASTEISMGDEQGIVMTASRAVSVIAEGQLVLKGHRIVIEAAKEASLVRKDMLSPTVVNLCNTFDLIGMTGGMKRVVPPSQDIKMMPLVTKDRYEVGAAMRAVLCSIPAEPTTAVVIDTVMAGLPVI